MVAALMILAVWPPHGPFSTAADAGDGLAWKIAAVAVAWTITAVVAWRTDFDDGPRTPGPGRVIDDRYRRGPRP